MITNEIKELHSGVFYVLVDFPNKDNLITQLVDTELPFVMLCGLRWGDYTWQQFQITGVDGFGGFARKLEGDTVMPTSEFLANHSRLKWRWAIQLE